MKTAPSSNASALGASSKTLGTTIYVRISARRDKPTYYGQLHVDVDDKQVNKLEQVPEPPSTHRQLSHHLPRRLSRLSSSRCP
jgi:hypothetical protein